MSISNRVTTINQNTCILPYDYKIHVTISSHIRNQVRNQKKIKISATTAFVCSFVCCMRRNWILKSLEKKKLQQGSTSTRRGIFNLTTPCVPFTFWYSRSQLPTFLYNFFVYIFIIAVIFFRCIICLHVSKYVYICIGRCVSALAALRATFVSKRYQFDCFFFENFLCCCFFFFLLHFIWIHTHIHTSIHIHFVFSVAWFSKTTHWVAMQLVMSLLN